MSAEKELGTTTFNTVTINYHLVNKSDQHKVKKNLINGRNDNRKIHATLAASKTTEITNSCRRQQWAIVGRAVHSQTACQRRAKGALARTL